MRVQAFLEDGETIASVVPLWPAADWFERETYDMLGIVFDGHPNLVRILMERRLGGASAPQGLPDRRRAGEVLERRMSDGARRRRPWRRC